MNPVAVYCSDTKMTLCFFSVMSLHIEYKRVDWTKVVTAQMIISENNQQIDNKK